MTFLNDIRNLPSGSVRSSSETSLFENCQYLVSLSNLLRCFFENWKKLIKSAQNFTYTRIKTEIRKDRNTRHFHRTSHDLKGGRRFPM